MNRYIYACMFLVTSLQAQIAEEDLSGVYTEAILFVTVFAIMSIVSYIYSTKHAKEYAAKNQSKIDEARLKDEENITNKKKRLEELSKMQNDGLLTKDELNVLKK